MRKPAVLVLVLFALSAILPALSSAQKKKGKDEKEEITQTLELPKDPPTTIQADTNRIFFDVSPLTPKGLLSQQVRDALKALQRMSRRGAIVKLRAFVAGSGDMRRVQTIVSESFTERRLPLPVLSVVQVGALPMEGAQVVIEATGVAKKTENPHGIAFISGQVASSDEMLLDVAPLARKSVAGVADAVKAAGAQPEDVLRATCFLSSLQDVNAVREIAAAQFPQAEWNFVQILRAPEKAIVECEAVARLRAPPGAPLRLLNPPGLPQSPNYSQIAMVGAPKLLLSGSRLAFRFQPDDARLAFQRLGRDLEQAGGSLRQVAMSSIYPLSDAVGDLVRKVRFEFYDKDNPPASTMLPFEGLPGLDASFAVEVVAVLPTSQ
jgi:enamine deaminase RidA (YjgF/YER057c/UK114 family)